ncbi:MAG TPA: hypothetical protein VGQ31_04600 [Candidatus Limnocylindrales bacterium]|jgi:hypothetical protein|nr:hypothetical protein [Candidatus Limnocylindrales bacterium]
MDDLDLDLDPNLDLMTRLSALEARAPGPAAPPELAHGRRRGRFALSLAMAPVLALAVVGAAAAGAAVISRMAEGYPGIENPGQPLAGANMECMTPPDAAAFLAAHGYTDVDWQVESGTAVTPEGGKGTSSSVHVTTPPAHGYVIPGSRLPGGRVIMVVDQRVGATGVGACFGHPMP